MYVLLSYVCGSAQKWSVGSTRHQSLPALRYGHPLCGMNRTVIPTALSQGSPSALLMTTRATESHYIGDTRRPPPSLQLPALRALLVALSCSQPWPASLLARTGGHPSPTRRSDHPCCMLPCTTAPTAARRVCMRGYVYHAAGSCHVTRDV